MDVEAKREGCYSELKIYFEITNLVSLTTLDFKLNFSTFYPVQLKKNE